MTKHDDDKYYLMTPLIAHFGEALNYASCVDQPSASMPPSDLSGRRLVRLPLKTFVFTLIVPGTVTVLLPMFLLAVNAALSTVDVPMRRWLGLIPIVLGVLVYAWCAWEFVRTGRGTPAPAHPPQCLVQTGLYRHSRNPIYIGVELVLLGESLCFESTMLLVYAVLVAIGFQWRVVRAEEPALRRQFGEAYDQYCQHVHRWIRISLRAFRF